MQEFFPDEGAFRRWIQQLPPVYPSHEDTLANPNEPWAATTEGPYFYSPCYLLLRIGVGRAARYYALRRVNAEESAFSWSVQGEMVYASYVYNRQSEPMSLVYGTTLPEARKALSTYLSSWRVRDALGKVARIF